jgi:hypothetical protein
MAGVLWLIALRGCLGSPPVFGGVCAARRFKFSVLFFLYCLSSFYVLCSRDIARFSGLSVLDCPFGLL